MSESEGRGKLIGSYSLNEYKKVCTSALSDPDSSVSDIKFAKNGLIIINKHHFFARFNVYEKDGQIDTYIDEPTVRE